MSVRRRREAAGALAVSLAVHLLVLALLAVLAPKPEEPFAGAPAELVAPVYLLPRRPHRATAGKAAAAPPGERRPRAPAAAPPSLAPAPFAPASPTPQGSSSATASEAAPNGALSAALRGGAIGCANPVLLSRRERERCEDRLGRGAATAAAIPAPIEPAKRAYYDAVVAAKDAGGQLVPLQAPGSLGLLDSDRRAVKGHLPSVGCKIPFGGPRNAPKGKLPEHWLKLGPCFVAPPQGPLTVEADISPP